jgi:hypothetical protein
LHHPCSRILSEKLAVLVESLAAPGPDSFAAAGTGTDFFWALDSFAAAAGSGLQNDEAPQSSPNDVGGGRIDQKESGPMG